MGEKASPPILPPLREVIKRHGLQARRALGQNFLLDLNLTRAIVRAADCPANATVIEIGPGPGGLTRALLESPAERVFVIEKDVRFVPVIEELKEAYPDRLELLVGDALDLNVSELGQSPRYIIANLPYNIATELLFRWVENIQAFEGFILMFQKEVADRILAKPHTKTYGRLSIKLQWLCHIKQVMAVPKEAFTPSPKVNSTVLHLEPRVKPLAEADPTTLDLVVKTAFMQRRKMLRSSLGSLSVPTDILLEKANITPTLRAENLSVEDFCTLARAYDELKSMAKKK
ncbi:MAG: 16S rRNA (adenine(1518)-N(6)/adenine(1519)-N(6))-dimethyltransferase RsmA [Alphaproteobacteria bacterium]|nr:16S rRNA (adenine(1518)-N(6)/adenine(1519)-N(6))-dimethyltransferase RsmA [Alphaproteobacteria bacterium]MBT5389324.1 16S rRNA (adenine(1518)-N(6)/adenine(1519)-N(6))-dimethyltransferase RsmA [Alphaproteobacteria bacterium]MBT5541137.1 16S rRNA (adenine(1518)-N(6)/adenine(1519)-N(6))-dimethyltransferase RsmA [Alphaproteobacteria bacterium]MBT5654632.1 16S rRNA (adenine(1518)-N(6)/adenine(1519)-N(6))-dimethyltransferase RsmA [Alphaproteobacteria bacterium]